MDKHGREYMRKERLTAEERKWAIRDCAQHVFLASFIIQSLRLFVEMRI